MSASPGGARSAFAAHCAGYAEDGHNDGEKGEEEGEESRRLRTALAFMCGLGREGMPRDVFRVVLELLMPRWDPVRRKNAGAVPQMPQR